MKKNDTTQRLDYSTAFLSLRKTKIKKKHCFPRSQSMTEQLLLETLYCKRQEVKQVKNRHSLTGERAVVSSSVPQLDMCLPLKYHQD